VNRPKIALRGAAFLAVGAAAALTFAAPDARKEASDILEALARKPDAQRVASESLGKARAALRRSDQMRKSGDNQHGALLEQTALEWATASALLDRTAAREKELFELQSKTTELENKVFRAQALIEQTVARRARAEEAVRAQELKAVKP
jgi:hypothetical protein